MVQTRPAMMPLAQGPLTFFSIVVKNFGLIVSLTLLCIGTDKTGLAYRTYQGAFDVVD